MGPAAAASPAPAASAPACGSGCGCGCGGTGLHGPVMEQPTRAAWDPGPTSTTGSAGVVGSLSGAGGSAAGSDPVAAGSPGWASTGPLAWLRAWMLKSLRTTLCAATCMPTPGGNCSLPLLRARPGTPSRSSRLPMEPGAWLVGEPAAAPDAALAAAGDGPAAADEPAVPLCSWASLAAGEPCWEVSACPAAPDAPAVPDAAVAPGSLNRSIRRKEAPREVPNEAPSR